MVVESASEASVRRHRTLVPHISRIKTCCFIARVFRDFLKCSFQYSMFFSLLSTCGLYYIQCFERVICYTQHNRENGAETQLST